MKGVLLKATNSMQVDSSFLSKVQALCDTLVEDVAVEIVKYTEKNKEVDTVKLKQRALMHLDEARQQFKYLQRIVCLWLFMMGPAVISEGLTSRVFHHQYIYQGECGRLLMQMHSEGLDIVGGVQLR